VRILAKQERVRILAKVWDATEMPYETQELLVLVVDVRFVRG
jgi:hypothetical protein